MTQSMLVPALAAQTKAILTKSAATNMQGTEIHYGQIAGLPVQRTAVTGMGQNGAQAGTNIMKVPVYVDGNTKAQYCAYLDSYMPQVGDVVALALVGTDKRARGHYIVIGRLASGAPIDRVIMYQFYGGNLPAGLTMPLVAYGTNYTITNANYYLSTNSQAGFNLPPGKWLLLGYIGGINTSGSSDVIQCMFSTVAGSYSFPRSFQVAPQQSNNGTSAMSQTVATAVAYVDLTAQTPVYFGGYSINGHNSLADASYTWGNACFAISVGG